MLLSIVIPVYKVERYIAGTLSSIYDQQADESEFEVIVVDNGTPDDSMTIVKGFAEAHTNLHQVKVTINRGLSRGRNEGLKAVSGDYIWHVDSDDQISRDSIHTILNLIKGHPTVDIFGFDITKVKEQDGESFLSPILPASQRTLYNQELPNTAVCPFLQGPVQRFVFRRSFVEERKLTFVPDLQHEDLEYLPKAYFHARRVYISDRPVYRYLLRYTGSLTSSLSPQSYPDRIKIMSMLDSYKQNGDNDKASRLMLDLYIFWIAFFLLSPDKYTFEHRSDFLSFIRDNTPAIRRAALRGIPALWHFGEVKRLPLALLLYVRPLWVNTIYYRKR